MMMTPRMNHLRRMTTELWHHVGPEHRISLCYKFNGQGPTYNPHASWIAIGIQRCEVLAELFTSLLKVSEDYGSHARDLWLTSSSRLAELASSSPAPWRHVCNEFCDILKGGRGKRIIFLTELAQETIKGLV